MFFKLPGMKMRVHFGTIQATPVPTDRLEEEAPGTWAIHRVSLETMEGDILSKGFGIAGRWDASAPKEAKASDKKADAPTPQKSEDVVTPVSPTEVMPKEPSKPPSPEATAKAEAAVAAYEESHGDHFGFNVNDYQDDYYSDPTVDLLSATVMIGFI